jgi:predicted membrane protein DUF2231
MSQCRSRPLFSSSHFNTVEQNHTAQRHVCVHVVSTNSRKNRHQDNDERSKRGRAWQNYPYFGELSGLRVRAIWLLGAGLIMAVLAAVAGLTDVIGEPRIRALSDVWWHAGGNVFVVLPSSIVPKDLVLSFVVVCTLLFTGWKGWEMVYRYRVGVADTIERRERTTAAPHRAA